MEPLQRSNACHPSKCHNPNVTDDPVWLPECPEFPNWLPKLGHTYSPQVTGQAPITEFFKSQEGLLYLSPNSRLVSKISEFPNLATLRRSHLLPWVTGQAPIAEFFKAQEGTSCLSPNLPWFSFSDEISFYMYQRSLHRVPKTRKFLPTEHAENA